MGPTHILDPDLAEIKPNVKVRAQPKSTPNPLFLLNYKSLVVKTFVLGDPKFWCISAEHGPIILSHPYETQLLIGSKTYEPKKMYSFIAIGMMVSVTQRVEMICLLKPRHSQ